ncbi:uncharacterized protein LOC131614563 [Vicia villosa]|uniref:uncharacterized protein LOC131614563 n=1 Tax=Vicia villosa TaxID=3911 RepID=UPI00273B1802|nr:uncharacterized protein LOC131614563 [Vicia villosa]
MEDRLRNSGFYATVRMTRRVIRLESVVSGGNANGAGIGANRKLGEFQRNNPPLFKGTYDPDGAQKRMKEIERIFRVIDCAENLKVRAELDVDGVAITWAIFRREFLRKYFPEDVRGRKEIEFLELKQGSMTVLEYASKCVELAKYYTHYNNDEANEFSRCIKFENGLRDEIKQGIRYQRIRRFADLVDCSRIFEEDNIKLKSSHSRELVDKKGKKPIDRGKTVTYYNCGEEGYISPQCPKPRKNQADDTGATYSFIFMDCAKRLNFEISDINGSMIIETPASGSTVIFPEEVSVEDLAMTARQVDAAVKDGAYVFMLFASMELKGKAVGSELPVIYEVFSLYTDANGLLNEEISSVVY